MSRRSRAWLLILGVVLIVVHALLASRLSTESDKIILYYTPVEAVIYALAVVVTLRDKGCDYAATTRAVVFILVVAAIMRGMIIPIDPVSTDINRYIWDGRVQNAGINPYLYVPADPALKDLRDDDIYPEINRKTYAPTIYPPLAQIVFYLVTRFDEDITVMKAAMVAFDGIAIWAIMQLMRMRGVPPTRILLYAWHPVPIWAFAGDGHVDAIAIACLCLGLLAAESRRPILAGIALGGATLTKFFPRSDWTCALSPLGLEAAPGRLRHNHRPLHSLPWRRQKAVWVFIRVHRRRRIQGRLGRLSLDLAEASLARGSAGSFRVLHAGLCCDPVCSRSQDLVPPSLAPGRSRRRLSVGDDIHDPDVTALHLVFGLARAFHLLLSIVGRPLADLCRNLHEQCPLAEPRRRRLAHLSSILRARRFRNNRSLPAGEKEGPRKPCRL